MCFLRLALFLSVPRDPVTIVVGYRVGECVLDALPKMGKGCKIIPKDLGYLKPTRPPMAVSLGVHMVGVCLPHPDSSHLVSVAAGARKRYLREIPKYFAGISARRIKFIAHVDEWLKTIPKIAVDEDFTRFTWLLHTHYQQWRKDELELKALRS